MGKLTPSKIGSILMTVSCRFLYWISELTNKIEFLLRSVEARVVFKTQRTSCQLMPYLNHSQIRLRAPAEPTFNICEIHRAPNSFSTSAKASREIKFSIFFGLRDFHHKVSNLPGNILKEVSRWRLCRLSQVPYLPPSHSGTGGFANEKEVAQKMGAHQKPHPLLSSPAFNQQRLPKPLRKRHWIFSLYFFFF